MSKTPLLAFRSGIVATVAAVMSLGIAMQAQSAEPYPSDIQQPDYTALLSDFGNYYDSKSPRSKNIHICHLQNHLSTVKPPIGN